MTEPSPADEPEPEPESEPESESGGRRRLAWAWAALVVVVLGVGGFAASRSEFLDVDEVRILGVSEGEERGLSEARLREATGVRLGSPLWRVDVDAVVRRVASEPWVAAVEVDRRWPGAVEVWVRQRVAVANAVDPSAAVALLDAEGTVVEHRAVEAPDLPVVRVERLGRPGTRMAGLTPLLRAVVAMPPELGPWIVALVPTASGVVAELVGGAEAALGLGEDYRDEFRSLATVLARVELACIVEIDVSLHAGPVVRRDDLRCG